MSLEALERRRARNRVYSRVYSKSDAGKATKQRYLESEHGKKSVLWSAKLHHLKKKYGLTPETWAALFEQQGRRCAACGATDPGGKKGWHVDHDHNINTPHARAILCNPCNVTLAHAKDSPSRLAALVRYLENWQSRRINGS